MAENVLPPGRPNVALDIDDAMEMLDLGFNVADIARTHNCSRPTVYKKLKEAGCNINRQFSSISDLDLENLVSEIKSRHPNSGEVYMACHIRAHGLRLQRWRLRRALHEVDPRGIELRKSKTVTRRKYSVSCPNYLWHIDGTHKLIQWKFVVHAGIDGFSRLVVYIHCSDNNKSSTVVQLFKHAVNEFGLPIRVRSDYGGENQLVWETMYEQRGFQYKSVITGSSVHNERIERLNYDINYQVVSVFKQLFMELEGRGHLDPENESDLFCLHYVFLPRINRCLSEFQYAHNNHRISTEGNHTPNQLFYQYQHLIPLHETPSEDSATDLNIPFLSHVNVPNIICPLSNEQFRVLVHRISPLSEDENPIVIYERVAQYVYECLSEN